MNALKHGFRFHPHLRPGRHGRRLPGTEKPLQGTIPPSQTTAEEILWENLVKDAWSVYRAEMLLYDDPESEKLQRNLARCKTSYRSSMKQLANYQTNRLLQEMLPAPLNEGTLPPMADVKGVLNFAKRTHRSFPQLAINHLSSQLRKEQPALDEPIKTSRD